jgi:hypothetical protein
LLGAGSSAQQPTAPPAAANAFPAAMLPDQPELEPKALEILKAASSRLASAQRMTFTAVASYESPARTLHPLVYYTQSEVAVQRPDKLQVITVGDGPRSEFYYDGKTMTAFEPEAGLTAIGEAPATIDEMLKVAFLTAGYTFPFDDLVVADPYKALGQLRLAFVVGQSRVVGGVVTDIVAVATEQAQAQIWVGADDKLPRMVRVTYFNEPGQFRHGVEFSNWKVDPVLPPGTFTSERAASGKRVKFASPDTPPTGSK